MASVLISSVVEGFTVCVSLFRQTPTTSSTATTVVDDLEWLEKTLKRIEALMQDAEKQDIQSNYLKLWLTEIKDVAYDAQDLLDEYQYQVLRAQVEEAAAQASRKRKLVDGEEEVMMTLATSSASNILAARKISILSNMAGRIDKIRKRLDAISTDQERLQLKPEDGPRRPDIISPYPLPTSHMIDEQKIYGREEEREKLVDWLLSKPKSKCEVLAVVGKGGLGKTTLAQLVYNDPQVEKYFQQRMWIFVSSDCGTIKLTKDMVQSIKSPDKLPLPDQLSDLQKSLEEGLRGKRVLLVLDDVWNHQKSWWETLSLPFCSAEMMRIIVTTRNVSVAEVMQATDPHHLAHLPEEQCLELFMRLAFHGRDPDRFPSLVAIGEKIVDKCDGLPLAVKSLGGLLQHESDEDRWNNVLHSKVWDEETDILPALKLSYIHLPNHLKPCFQICSIFPKGHLLEKEELVNLWAAHGYIHQHNCQKGTMEEIGYKYIDELHRRSLFDDYLESDESDGYKMHDNIHDLARYFLEERDLRKEGDHKIRHLYIEDESMESHLDKNNEEALRSLIVRSGTNIPVINDMMSGINTTRRLTHLRYLAIFLGDEDFSLPEGLGNLICLRHLAIESEGWSTVMMKLPNSIGMLTITTVSFSGFRNDQLPILGHLPSLRSLSLIHFNYVESIGNEFCRGGNNRNHVAFPSLTYLVLRDLDSWKKWDELQEGDFPRLQKLQIEGCGKLSSLPSLANHDLLSHMILAGCPSLRLSSEVSFPPNLETLEKSGHSILPLPLGFGKLKKLEMLRGLFSVRIDELFGILKKLVRLKCLTLSSDGILGPFWNRSYNMDSLELFHGQKEVLHLVVESGRDNWSHCVDNDGYNDSPSEDATFSLFKNLLPGTLIDEDATFSQLKDLLPGTLIDLVSLTTIYFWGFHIDQLPAFGQLPSLKSLALVDMDKVKSIGNEFCRGGNNRHLAAFPSLTSLVFEKLTQWERWDELQEGDFPQLQKLQIKGCERLSSLPSLRNLSLLSYIPLKKRDSLQILPECTFPPNLKILENARELKLSLPQGFGEVKKLERLNGIFGVRIEEVFRILKGLVCLKRLILSALWNAHCAWNGEPCVNKYGGIEVQALNWRHVGELPDIPFSPDEDLYLVVERDDNKGSLHGDIEKTNSDDDDDDDQKLQSRMNLKELYFIGYCGVGYPNWIGDPTFDGLEKVRLFNCNVDRIPTLGQLPSLDTLYLRRINGLKRIGDEFCGPAAAFPSLFSLKFSDMYDWEQWDHGVRQGDFPKLKSLSIHGCPRLSQVPVLRHLGMNLELSICECPAIHIPAEGIFPPNMKTLWYRNYNPRIYLSPGAELLNSEHLTGIFRTRNEELFGVLNNLPVNTREMIIAALGNVRSGAMEAEEANLRSRHKLVELTLKWSADITCHQTRDEENSLCLVVEGDDDDDDDDGRTDQTEYESFIILEKLQPHMNLEELYITGYGGFRYPGWIGHPSFNRLAKINLKSCSNDQLPTLGQLPCLDRLCLDSISGLKRIGREFCRDNMMNNDNVAFPSLTFLSFRDMPDWEQWCGVLDQDFPRLKSIAIEECSRLRDLRSLPLRIFLLMCVNFYKRE